MRANLLRLSLTALMSLVTLPPATCQSAATSQGIPAGTSSPVYIYPLEARLVHSLNSHALTLRDHVLTTLTHVWTDGDCTLPAGTALSGDVTGIHEWTKQDKQTRVVLEFHYPCRQSVRHLRLITLLAPELPDLLGIHGNPVQMQAMRSSLYGEGNPLKSAGNTIQNHVDMSGQQNPQWPLFVSAEPAADHRPTEVKRGMVWHLPGVGLSLSDGEPSTTAIVSSHHSFTLPSETVLVMQPDFQSFSPSPDGRMVPVSSGGSAATTLATHPQLAALAPEINACPAATCTDLTSAEPTSIQPTRKFSVRRYGSLRAESGEIAGLEYSAAVAFLGPNELLVCVGKPGLVARTGNERPEDHPHLIEAVLYNRTTGQVERTVEWPIPNRERYLWSLPDGRILVHQGNRLVWYGPGLTAEHTMPLQAPLAYIRTTGDGRHLLIGTIHELHSAPQHAELYINDSRAPEEQVEETIYDQDFHPVAEHSESSRALPPLIWNTGQLSLRHRSKEIWYFRETAWAGTQRNFATLTSSCVPQTTVLSGDMLLVIGCETHSLNAWARILRPDGSIVLRTTVHPGDLYPVAPAASARDVVLVSPRILLTSNRDGVLHAADITGESVRVLRDGDGHVEFATELNQPTTSAQPVAIDPTGTNLAILAGDAVLYYNLPTATPTTHEQVGNP